jgi:RNA 2',3'-cyclic 3'-phosphodiesterase
VRLFIALDLDDASRAAIAAEQARLAKQIDRRANPKWVKPDQMHLTLVFLGEVEETRAADIAAAMRQPVDQRAFDAVFDDVGMFPPHGGPRVLWIGVAEGADDMIALQRTLADRVVRFGIALEDRPFHPHLTLARWRDARPSARRAVTDLGGGRSVARMRVDHATLYQSRLSPAGSTYTALARATLLPTLG